MKKATLFVLGLGLAAVAAAQGRVELGQTADQVRSGFGRPDRTFVALEAGRNVEVWSYDQPYRWFWLDCDQCAPQSPAGKLAESQPLACRERARVVFIDGRVAAFLARQ